MKPINKSKLITLAFAAFLIAAFVFISGYFDDENYRIVKGDVVLLEQEWNVYYEDKSILNTYLPIDLDLDSGVLYKAETYLPEDTSRKDHLLLRSSMQDIVVYLENIEIYRHENSSYGVFAKPPASLWLLVDLPEDYQGKKLTLDVTSEVSAFGGMLNEVKMGRAQDLLYDLIKSQFTGIIVFVILFLTGFIITIFSIFIRFAKDNRLLYLGFLSMSASVWILSEAKLMQFFTGNRFVIGGISYVMIPLIGVFLSLYIKEAVLSQHISKRLIKGISLGQALMILGIVLLQLAGLRAFIDTARYMNLIMSISILMIISIMIYEFERHRNNNVRRMFKYTAVIVISTALEIAAFYNNLFEYTSTFYRIGMLIFIGLLIYDAYIYLKENLEKNKEHVLLEKLAYKDFLTGGGNRSAYERDLENLKSKKKIDPFRLVILDLNDLKYINDTFGHNVGDDAIKATYYLAKEAFQGFGECYRIGGDEFIVLMDKPDKDIYKRCMENLRLGLNKKKSESSYPIDVAAGSGVYMENSWSNYSEFYHHVDQNMYLDKTKRKTISTEAVMDT
ncbi:GGDEF domain-containing protein [Alkalibacter saccharofermentans]|uniref:Diguanylate cyclase (GGDEF) domain-containing protein n=1 Tax=Alkalibacter saccharofermentans DSM 14828 TaxID=1120975 RepID=A0A1M4UQ82_9FIRM|nr:GGDEF domain-containing protein [Alkalibacter saccharofermentans]SHE58753.1 diguanylate cyclase (GGDEF) domain-containing protein [Alkalibacter saccharofermentans DSM 14828]